MEKFVGKIGRTADIRRGTGGERWRERFFPEFHPVVER